MTVREKHIRLDDELAEMLDESGKTIPEILEEYFDSQNGKIPDWIAEIETADPKDVLQYLRNMKDTEENRAIVREIYRNGLVSESYVRDILLKIVDPDSPFYRPFIADAVSDIVEEAKEIDNLKEEKQKLQSEIDALAEIRRKFGTLDVSRVSEAFKKFESEYNDWQVRIAEERREFEEIQREKLKVEREYEAIVDKLKNGIWDEGMRKYFENYLANKTVLSLMELGYHIYIGNYDEMLRFFRMMLRHSKAGKEDIVNALRYVISKLPSMDVTDKSYDMLPGDMEFFRKLAELIQREIVEKTET